MSEVMIRLFVAIGAVAPLAIAVKATVALLLAFALAAVARRQRAAVRHAVYAATFFFLLLLPLMAAFTPARPVVVRAVAPAVVQDGAPAVTSEPAAPPVPMKSSLPIGSVVTVLYLLGVGLGAARLAIGLWRIRAIARRAEVWTVGNDVLISDGVAVPMTFARTIVMPAEARRWSSFEVRSAMRHELAHVERNDWFLQLLARLALIVYWPHPLAWVAWKRFVLEAERACDDGVVASFGADEYAVHLVSLARRMQSHASLPALAMASPSKLAVRVRAILEPTQRRGPLGGRSAFAAAAVTALLLFTVAPLRLVAAPAPDDDINASIPGDGTRLLIAAKAGDLELVKGLIARGADPNVASPGDGNPLIAASGAGHVEVVEYLLDRGARIDEIVPEDENALIAACRSAKVDVVRVLIARGANVNARALANGDEWRTPLKMARRAKSRELIEMLVAAGAVD
jgi:beta-lactamase regulating signal transducer with metallopeptidase domain